ncbi:MAG: class I SAM-dependent methyltransferase [bacterium]|nr:class I SAM-dependent methyltransferase [bacterium]
MVFAHTNCRLCKSADLEQFLDLGAQPPANAFLRKEDFAQEEKYPLRIGICKNCFFVQLMDVVDPDTLFKEYLYVSSTSPLFVRHFEDYARFIDDRFRVKSGLVVDIGSNDGILLKSFQALGANILGIDPAHAIAEKATKEGIPTMTGYFTEDIARAIARKHGKAKVITANNVFAHIHDLDEVMRAVRALLLRDGVFVIEAPYLAVFLEDRLFDTIYHEHLSYIALTPLVSFFAKYGMEIIDVEKVSSHGGSVRIMIGEKGAHRADARVARYIDEEKNKGLQNIETYKKFAAEVLENRRLLVELLHELKKAGKRVVGYGAPAKGNTLLNFMRIGPDVVEYIVDDSPLKQGLFTPGMHIPVVSQEQLKGDHPDYVFILAWNFADAIMKKNEEFNKKGGKFIIPVPVPRIVDSASSL